MAKGATEFGKWLYQQMKEHNIDHELLAEEIGLSDRAIRYYIYNGTKPRKKNMQKIMEYFGQMRK